LFTLLASLGVALWLSAMNVLYRDVRVALPFLVQVWLFLTPVLYPTSLVPEGWRWLYALNPMTAVTESFRWAMLKGAAAPDPLAIAASGVAVLVLLFSGVAYFRHIERQMADSI
jgi:lipopolysaccharide transport system permease protein